MVRGLYFQAPAELLRPIARILACGGVTILLCTQMSSGQCSMMTGRLHTCIPAVIAPHDRLLLWEVHASFEVTVEGTGLRCKNKTASLLVGVHGAQSHNEAVLPGILHQMLRELHSVSPANQTLAARTYNRMRHARRAFTALATCRQQPGVAIIRPPLVT